MKLNIIFISVVFAAFLSFQVYASFEISVTTDKESYQLGESVDISISVFNSASTSETLWGGFYFTTYIMDGIYDWADRPAPHVVRQLTFLPEETKTWEMSHGFNEMQVYPLTIGTHSVIGGAGYSLRSAPVEFQVIPEPATLFLLTLGTVLLRKK